MGRMVFNIIPRDGKGGIHGGAAAAFDFSDAGRYEMYITDYACDVCAGEVQTARRAWCRDASALLTALATEPELKLDTVFTLGALQAAMASTVPDIDAFFALCRGVGVVYEELPLLIERHD